MLVFRLQNVLWLTMLSIESFVSFNLIPSLIIDTKWQPNTKCHQNHLGTRDAFSALINELQMINRWLKNKKIRKSCKNFHILYKRINNEGFVLLLPLCIYICIYINRFRDLQNVCSEHIKIPSTNEWVSLPKKWATGLEFPPQVR